MTVGCRKKKCWISNPSTTSTTISSRRRHNNRRVASTTTVARPSNLRIVICLLLEGRDGHSNSWAARLCARATVRSRPWQLARAAVHRAHVPSERYLRCFGLRPPDMCSARPRGRTGVLRRAPAITTTLATQQSTGPIHDELADCIVTASRGEWHVCLVVPVLGRSNSQRADPAPIARGLRACRIRDLRDPTAGTALAAISVVVTPSRHRTMSVTRPQVSSAE
jgi:hypothetical protein